MVELQGNSSNSGVSYAWSGPAGFSSTEQNPEHIFTADSIYVVCLTATNDFGSNESCLSLMINVKTDDITFPSDWSVFPNPVTNLLNIQFNQEIPYQGDLKIFDSKGKLIIRQSIDDNIKLKTNQLTSGTYIINITDAQGRQYFNRFIKL